MAYLWFLAAAAFSVIGIHGWVSGDRRQALSDLLLIPLLLVLGLERAGAMPEDAGLIWGMTIGLAAAGILLHVRRMLAERR